VRGVGSDKLGPRYGPRKYVPQQLLGIRRQSFNRTGSVGYLLLALGELGPVTPTNAWWKPGSCRRLCPEEAPE